MALIPSSANASELIQCEWRLFLSPQCSYVNDLVIISKVSFYFYWITATWLAALLFYRLFVLRAPLFKFQSKYWFFSLRPVEAQFISTAFNNLVRAIQVTLLLYAEDSTPLFLRNFLFTLGHSVAASFLAYFWISLILTVPHEKIIHEKGILSSITELNVALGVILIVVFMLLGILEGVSAHYTLTNLPLANALMTTSYTIWVFGFWLLSGSITYFGMKLLKILKASASFHTEFKDDESKRQLQKTHDFMRPLVLLIGLVTNTCGGFILIVLIARYYIWQDRGWSDLFCILFNLTSGLYCVVGSSIVFFNDLRLKKKYDRQEGKHSSSHESDHTPRPKKDAELPLSKTENSEEVIETFLARNN